MPAALWMAKVGRRRGFMTGSLIAIVGNPDSTLGRNSDVVLDASVDQEAWLRSVEEYFPNDEFYVPLAQMELARFYLRHERYPEALEASQKLARRGGAARDDDGLLWEINGTATAAAPTAPTAPVAM